MNEKHPCCSTAEHPKHSMLSIANIQEKPAPFFNCHPPGRHISTRKNLAYLGSCAVSVPVYRQFLGLASDNFLDLDPTLDTP